MTDLVMLKLKNPKIFDTPEWRIIAHEKDEGKIEDDEIYFYIEDNVDFSKLKIGEKIKLDEDFEIAEIQHLN